MADLSRDDVQRAVREGLNEFRNDIQRIRDDIQKIEQRTNDLDRTQDEIQRLIPRFETLARQMEEVHDDADKIDRVVVEINGIKSQLQSSVGYLQQVSEYLGGVDQRLREKFGDASDDGFRK